MAFRHIFLLQAIIENVSLYSREIIDDVCSQIHSIFPILKKLLTFRKLNKVTTSPLSEQYKAHHQT
jgi:hypothetical protein